jgi:hypothetical protein
MSLKIRRVLVLAGLASAAALSTAWAQAPSVTVSGVGYAQYLYQLHEDPALGAHQNSFDVTRGYVNVIGKFNGGVMARITMDVTRNAGTGGQLNYRLKYAYAAWTPENSPITMKLGLIHTPWLDWEEALWDYRMQGSMPMERYLGSFGGGGRITSADFGAGLDGTWSKDLFNAQVGLYNGEGYSNPEGDQRKDIEARASVRVLETDQGGRVGGLRLTAYGQYGKPTGGGQRERFIGMASYKSKMVTLAAEFGWAQDSSTAGPSAQVKGRVLAAYGVLNIPNSKFAIIGRVDLVDPNTASAATNDRVTRIIGGVSYQVSPNLRLLADVNNESLQGGSTAAQDATRSQALFQTQFTF